MDSAKVKIDLSALKKFGVQIETQMNLENGSPIATALKQWGYRYRSFVQERFDSYSKGAGNWPPLALSTIRKRRKGPKKKGKATRSSVARDTANGGALVDAGGSYSILRDIGLLFQALDPTFKGSPGALQESIPFGILVGFGGNARQPGSKATISEIANYHQRGGGRLPKREIIVEPPPNVLELMAKDMTRALKKLADEIQ